VFTAWGSFLIWDGADAILTSREGAIIGERRGRGSASLVLTFGGIGKDRLLTSSATMGRLAAERQPYLGAACGGAPALPGDGSLRRASPTFNRSDSKACFYAAEFGFGEGNSGDQGPAGLEFYEEEKESQTPGDFPAAFKFAGQYGDNGVG
jgi:hypothetical protein